MKELFNRLWNDSKYFVSVARGAVFIGASIAESYGYLDATWRTVLQGSAIMMPAGDKNATVS